MTTTIVVAVVVLLSLLGASLVYFEARVRRTERLVMRGVRNNDGCWVGAGLISAAFGLNFSMVLIAGRRLCEQGLIERRTEEGDDGLVFFYRAKV